MIGDGHITAYNYFIKTKPRERTSKQKQEQTDSPRVSLKQPSSRATPTTIRANGASFKGYWSCSAFFMDSYVPMVIAVAGQKNRTLATLPLNSPLVPPSS